VSLNAVEKLLVIERVFDNLIQPLNYFKKFNILPIELIEEEIEAKYFTKEDLYMSNLKIFKKKYRLLPIDPYSLIIPCLYGNIESILLNRFSEIYNIDTTLLCKYSLIKDIIANLDKYKNNGVLDKYLYNNLYNQIIEHFNKLYQKYNNKATEYMKQPKYNIKLDDLHAGMCIKFPNTYMDEIWIKKICAKTIKYGRDYDYYCSDYKNIIKKEKLEYYMNIHTYKVYKIDNSNIHNIFGTYLYDEDNNLVLE
tara:strand:+ start:893 stop:1648 length:756 start_codon:yes stop_codon:yes gene_type:complete